MKKSLFSILLIGIVFLNGCSPPAYILENELLVEQGRTEEAIANYRNLIAADPKEADLYYQLAKIYYHIGSFDEAKREIDRAVLIDPLVDRHRLLAGKISYELRDYFNAINHLTSCLTINDRFLEAHLLLARAYEKIKQTGKALGQLQVAVSIEPLFFEARMTTVSIKFNVLKERLKEFNSVSVSTSPVISSQSPINSKTSKKEDSKEKDSKGENLNDDSDSDENAFENVNKSLSNLAFELEEALIISPRSIEGNLLLSQLYYSMGAIYKAKSILEEWLAEYPAENRVLTALARLEYESGNFKAAERLLIQLKDPDLAQTLFSLKVKKAVRPKFDMKPTINKLQSQYPDSEGVYLMLGELYLKEGDLVDAERAIQQSLSIKPDFADAYYQLSHILKAQNDYLGSRWALRKAFELAPDDFNLQLQYVQGLIVDGEWDKASQFINFFQSDSQNPDIIFIKGLIAKEKGDYFLAEQLFLSAQRKQFSPEIELQFADIDIEQGKFVSAEKRLKRVEAFVKNNVDIALVKAKLLFRMKRISEIPVLLRPYKSRKLGDGKVHLSLAEAFVQLGKLKGAVAILKEGLHYWPRHPDLVQTYTLYLGLIGNYREAIRILEEMQTYKHKYNELFYYRLRAYYFHAGEIKKFQSYPHVHRSW